MAAAPRQVPPAVANDVEDPLVKEMNALVGRALTDRARHQSRISDCYKYALPWLHKFFQNVPNDGLDEIFDELIQCVLEDFAADMLNTFTPQKNNWLEEKPLESVAIEDKRRLKEPLAKKQAIIFSEMARSNLYQALQECYLHLGPGTMAMLITDIDATKPLHCECIPAVDLLLAKGPYGTADPFRRKNYLRAEAEVLWPDADWNVLGPKPVSSAEQELEITDGCWRDWKDKGDETYHYLVQCNGKRLYHKQYKGPGSCPYIIGKWSADATTAWGFGPTYKVLPAIKTRNHVRYLALKNYDFHVDPAKSYEDDGVANFDNGIEPGKMFPRAVGSKAPEVMESKAKFDVQVFEMDELASIIKRAHYQDRPEQLGKTPPTATQWSDEAAERARRMGTPATGLVHGWQIPIYRRFTYLLDQRGVLPKVTIDGRIVQIEPISPLLRAQEQEEVVRNDRFAELIIARFGPQAGMVVINLVNYAQRQGKLLGVSSDLIREDSEIKAAIEQLMPVLKSTGFLPGSTPDVAVPAGVPVGQV